MEKFNYKARDKEGKAVSGVVESKDVKQAAKVLHDRGLLIVSLKPKKAGILAEARLLPGRVGIDDKVNFTRQLATMINAGLPLTEALAILEIQSRPGMATVVSDILREVEGGGSLSAGLEKHLEVFDRVYTSLVKAGEEAGVLNDILARLADNLEKQRDFRRKIKGAMIYPAIIVSGMIVVIVVMILFVIPRLTMIYEEFQAELPLATRILITISKFATSYFWMVLLLLAGGVVGLRILAKTPGFREQYDQVLFKLPIIGKLREQLVLTEFSRTLGLLVGSGILVNDALDIVEGALESRAYKQAVKGARRDVERGLPLAASLSHSDIFPPLVPQMIAIGEETGKLDEILARISVYFEQEAEVSIKGLTTAMEPLIMILLGVGVGFLMVAVIMPIYKLTTQF